MFCCLNKPILANKEINSVKHTQLYRNSAECVLLAAGGHILAIIIIMLVY